jgi:hypothetical protein
LDDASGVRKRSVLRVGDAGKEEIFDIDDAFYTAYVLPSLRRIRALLSFGPRSERKRINMIPQD